MANTKNLIDYIKTKRTYETFEDIDDLVENSNWKVTKREDTEDGAFLYIESDKYHWNTLSPDFVGLWIDVETDEDDIDDITWNWNKDIFNLWEKEDQIIKALQENENMWYIADELASEAVNFSRKRKFSKKFSNRRNFAKSDVAFGKQLADYYGLVTFEPKFEGVFESDWSRTSDAEAEEFSEKILAKFEDTLRVDEILAVCNRLKKSINIKLKIYHVLHEEEDTLSCEWECPNGLFGICSWKCELIKSLPLC